MNSEATESTPQEGSSQKKKRDITDFWPLGAIVFYFVLKFWILPAFGVPT